MNTTTVPSLLGCWELCSTEPREELFHLGTRVQIQFTDDGWHIYCSAGLTPLGMGWDILLATFTIDGSEIILKPEKEINSPYVSSDGFEIINPGSGQGIERIPFLVSTDGPLTMFGEVQCVFKRVENLAFSLRYRKRVT